MPAKPKTVTDKSDLEVLAPVGVMHTIGGKEFEQLPLALVDLGSVMGLAFQLLQIASNNDALDTFTNIDLTTEDGRAAATPALMQLLAMAPAVLPQAVAAVLRVTAADDIELIRMKCRPVTLLRIIDTFMEQNEPEELIEAFFILKARWTKTAEVETAEE